MNAAVLATRRAGDRAVLQFQEAAGVDHHGHDELTLPLREAEVCEARHPADTDAGGRDGIPGSNLRRVPNDGISPVEQQASSIPHSPRDASIGSMDAAFAAGTGERSFYQLDEIAREPFK